MKRSTLGLGISLSLLTIMGSTNLALSNSAVPQTPLPSVSLKPVVTPSEYNLALSARLPFQLADNQITWEINSLDPSLVKPHRLQGQHAYLQLPTGLYQVSLQIGNYHAQQQAQVTQQQGSAPIVFQPNIGYLRAQSDMARDWQLLADNKPEPIMMEAASNHFNRLLVEGEYAIYSNSGGQNVIKRIRVETGKTTYVDQASKDAKVNLVATLQDAPAMRFMHWSVYRVENGDRQEIASTTRHSSTIVVPPGQYEAVARLDGVERKRIFRAQPDTSNDVVLALDRS